VIQFHIPDITETPSHGSLVSLSLSPGLSVLASGHSFLS